MGGSATEERYLSAQGNTAPESRTFRRCLTASVPWAVMTRRRRPDRLRVKRAQLAGTLQRLADIDLLEQTGRRSTPPSERAEVVDRIAQLQADIDDLAGSSSTST